MYEICIIKKFRVKKIKLIQITLKKEKLLRDTN